MLKFFQLLHQKNNILSLVGWAHFVAAILILIVMPFDNRELLGINIWIKPLKFLISGGIYLWTMVFILDFLKEYPGRKNLYAFSFSLAMLVEMICIVIQAVRGEKSHYNESSALNGIIFSTMGIFFFFNTIMLVLLMLDFYIKKMVISRDMLWAIRLSLLIIILASAEGGLLVANKAHTVGAADGGEGVWFLNWSTRFGDLRVTHFIGIHAIQIIPLSVLLFRKLNVSVLFNTRLVFLQTGLFIILMLITLIQALNKIPFIPFT